MNYGDMSRDGTRRRDFWIPIRYRLGNFAS